MIPRLGNSLRDRLLTINVLTVGVALALVCAVLISGDVHFVHTMMREHLEVKARIVGSNCTAALSFGDRKAAREMLEAFASAPNIVQAVLHGKDGTVFASYARSSKAVDDKKTWVDRLVVTQPIVLDGDIIGTIHLESDLSELYARLFDFAVFVLLAALVLFLTTSVLLSRLQRQLTTPFQQLAELMKKASLQNDYSGRASVSGVDEVAHLATGFNIMADQIQAHEMKVRKHQDYLEEQVTKRTAQYSKELDDKKRLETALLAAAKQWRTSFDAIGDCVCLLNIDGVVLRCNRAMATLLDMPFVEILERNINDLVYSPVNAETSVNACRIRTLKGRETFTLALGKRWFDVTIDPIHGESGETKGCVHIMIDISKRKETEDELRLREEKYRTLFEESFDGVFITSVAGRILDMNIKGIAMFGYDTKEDILRLDLERDVYAYPSDRSRILAMVNAQGAADYEVVVKKKDGEKMVTHCSLTAVKDEKGVITTYRGIIRDISERKKAEEKLKESEQKYRLIAENVRDIIWTADMSLHFTYVSPAVLQMRGYSVEEALAQTIEDVLTPESLELATKSFAEEVAKEEQPGSDPSRSSTLQLEEYCKGGSTIWTESTMTFLRGLDNKPTGILGVTRNISERMRLEQQLVQAQKMEAIGTLAGGVAHDFNNILSVIISYAGFALDALPKNDPVKEDIIEIKQAGERAAALTRQLLAFSRKQVVNPDVLIVNDVINNLSKMLRRLIGEHIQMSLRFNPDAGEVLMDPSQLEQILVNLVVNARDAMPKGGKLIIETTSSIVAPDNPALYDNVTPGEYVVISVADTGIGMDKDLQKKIFEPFFSTKPKFKGTGLGLSMVYGAVRQNGGTVKVYSEPGLGATFRIYLKKHKSAGTTKAAESAARLTKGAGELVLLVEDEEPVRRAVCKMLEGNGYRVIAVADGKTGLAAFLEHGGEIAVVLSDVVMPGMSGIEMSKKIRDSSPHMRLLLMSGYTDEVLVGQGVTDSEFYILTKPFEQDLLLTKLREILDK